MFASIRSKYIRAAVGLTHSVGRVVAILSEDECMERMFSDVELDRVATYLFEEIKTPWIVALTKGIGPAKDALNNNYALVEQYQALLTNWK